MAFLDALKKVGRVGLAIGTGGASELAIAGYNAAKPDPLKPPDLSGTNYGTVPNPEYLTWKASKDRWDAQAKSDPTWAKDPNGYAAAIRALGPPPAATVQAANQVTDIQGAQANASAAGAKLGSAAQRVVNIGQQITSPAPGQTAAQTNAALSASAGSVQAFNPAAASALAGARAPVAAGAAAPRPAASVAGVNTAPPATDYAGQAAAANARQSQQIAPQSTTNQTAALNAAAGFNPATQGAAGIRSATANTSGAAGLANFQSPNTAAAAANINAQQPTNTLQGARTLQNFNPQAGTAAAGALSNFNPTAAAGAIQSLRGLNQSNTLQGAGALQNFQTNGSGIGALNQFAGEAQGPSAAQALLRSQSDKDKRTAIAIARSARGGPAAVAAALRQAQSEGAAMSAETRGQAAALSAQEFDTFKNRQLSALQASGQLISTADAQRLGAAQAAGQLLSDADQQKLAAYQSVAQASTAQDAQRVTALSNAASTLSSADAQRLSAAQASGQLLSQADQQKLQAATSAGQLSAQQDTNSLAGKTAAANINLEGSKVNQAGQIAATNAELTGSGQKLQAVSLQGQISSDIANQKIEVLKANQSAQLQQLGLNDQQTRAFAQINEDARQADQNVRLQAEQMGINADVASEQLKAQWAQFAFNQLTSQQQIELNKAAIAAGVDQANAQAMNAFTGQVLGFAGTGLAAAGKAAA
jgi:hypothetical protein